MTGMALPKYSAECLGGLLAAIVFSGDSRGESPAIKWVALALLYDALACLLGGLTPLCPSGVLGTVLSWVSEEASWKRAGSSCSSEASWTGTGLAGRCNSGLSVLLCGAVTAIAFSLDDQVRAKSTIITILLTIFALLSWIEVALGPPPCPQSSTDSSYSAPQKLLPSSVRAPTGIISASIEYIRNPPPMSPRGPPSPLPSAAGQHPQISSARPTLLVQVARAFDPAKEAARQAFLSSAPGLPGLESRMLSVRAKDFARLDNKPRCVYLDYTGAMLAPSTLVGRHMHALQNTILGNPHSVNTPSAESSKQDDVARAAVLRFVRADPNGHEVVWTANASASIKIVAESYPFAKGGILYAPDVHNSVLGMGGICQSKGGRVSSFAFAKDSLCWDLDSVRARLAEGGRGPGWLFVIPGQSNASGIKHPIQQVITMARAAGWDVMLDAAALAPSGGLDMSCQGVDPDYVAISFYKIFGYPTGIGALIAKKSSLNKLRKPWFAGGTVRVVSDPRERNNKAALPLMHSRESSGHWEDGTINFQQTMAVRMGVEMIESIGQAHLSAHLDALSGWLASSVRSLRWPNGMPLAVLPSVVEPSRQGSTVSFMPLLDDGSLLPAPLIETMAMNRGIAVRTGCFCNPGTGFQMFDLHAGEKVKWSGFGQIEMGKTMGSVRASVGLPTSFDDVYEFVAFLREDVLTKPEEMARRAKEHVRNATIEFEQRGTVGWEGGGVDMATKAPRPLFSCMPALGCTSARGLISGP